MLLKASLFLLGAVFWTFLEYALHRGLGHNPKLKNLFTVEHLLHHKEVNYFAAAYKKAAAAIVVVGGVTLVLGAVIGWANGLHFPLAWQLCIWFMNLYIVICTLMHLEMLMERYCADTTFIITLTSLI